MYGASVGADPNSCWARWSRWPCRRGAINWNILTTQRRRVDLVPAL
jgi:hypothetical protein